MRKLSSVIIVLVVLFLLRGISFAQDIYNPLGLQWDANAESDLAGYYVYEATTSGGYTAGTYAVSVPATVTVLPFIDYGLVHADGEYFWVVTAYDLAGNESGFSNEVTAKFDTGPPEPPTGCMLYTE